VDHLKAYPIDYCSTEVIELLPEIMRHGLSESVGEYLDSRIVVPHWNQSIERGNLVKIEEAGGINFTSTSLWPGETQQIKKRILSKEEQEVPIKLEILDA